MKWDVVGSILKQTKRKHQLTIKTCIKYVDKKSPVMRPNLQPKIYKSPVVATGARCVRRKKNKKTKKLHNTTIVLYCFLLLFFSDAPSPCGCSIATLSHVCNYKVQFCAFKGDTQNLPLRRVGRGEISPIAVPRG